MENVQATKIEQLAKEELNTKFTRVGYNGEPDGTFDVAPLLNFFARMVPASRNSSPLR